MSEGGIWPDAVVLRAVPRVLNIDENGVCGFFADERIKALLNGYEISKAAVNAQDEYAARFNHINS